MLSNTGRFWVGWIMRIGCFFKLYPYTWDTKAYRLKPAGWFHLIIYNMHGYTNCIMGTFAIVRFLLALKFEEFPARIRILNFAWSLVYSLGIISFIQFKFNKKQIFTFANALFAYVDKCKAEEEQAEQASTRINFQEDPNTDDEIDDEAVNNRKTLAQLEQQKLHREFIRNRDPRFLPAKKSPILFKKDGTYDWISLCVYTAIFLLLVNPPIHAIMVVDSPCAPHFVSSMGLPCTYILENFGFQEKFPYILVETILTGVFFFNFTFNWICVFLGLAWIKNELKKIKLDREDCVQEVLYNLPKQYRYVQNVMAHLNASFIYYLQLSPSILMSVVALLAFGAIKYYHLHFTAYMMYPLCGGRCFFEAISQLGIAGYVNQDGTTMLRKWNEISAEGIIHDKKLQKLNKYYWKSSAVLQCRAGSLYTFENTIIIASIHNCMQLTFNLLVMYK